MSYIVLDTDVVSQIFKRRLPTPLQARLAGRPTCITFVTYGELTQWAIMRNWSPRSREALTRWLTGIPSSSW